MTNPDESKKQRDLADMQIQGIGSTGYLGICPSCGYCPTCGRGRDYNRPQDPYPLNPWQPHVYY